MAENVLLQILTAFVNGTPPETADIGNAGEILVKAYAQNIQPVIAYMNSKYHFIADETVDAKLTELLYQTVFISANRFARFERLSQLLSDEQIAHMPVKGWYLKELYPAPELRTFGDIDILIRPADRERCDRLLLQEGYTPKQDWEPSYSYQKGNEYYEFHTELIDTELSCAPGLADYFANAWEHSIGDGGERWRLRPEYHFIYVLCHLAKHLYTSGAGIRMYLDIALALKGRGDELDFGFILGELERLGLGKFYATVIAAVNDWFDMSADVGTPAVDKSVTDRLLSYTFGSDLFGKSRDHTLITLRNTDATKGKAIKQTLFPDSATLEKRYTFVKGRKWLVPAAWAMRVFKNSGRIGTKLGDIKRLSEADYGDVDGYDAFISSVGL